MFLRAIVLPTSLREGSPTTDEAISVRFRIVAVSLLKKAYQPAALNAAWSVIALVALGQLLVRS